MITVAGAPASTSAGCDESRRRLPPPRRRTRSRGGPRPRGEPIRPRKLRFVVVTARSPAPRTPIPPPKQAPQVGVETIAARLDEDVEQALAHRLAVDPLRRGDDDQRGSRDGRGCPRSISAAWRRSVIVPFEQLPMYAWSIFVPGRLRDRHDVARQVRQRDQRVELASRSIAQRLRELGVGVGLLRRPRAVGAAVEVRARSSRRPGRSPVSAPASTAMFATASRSSIDSAAAPSPDELERRVRAAADADLADHGEDQVLAGDERAASRR